MTECERLIAKGVFTHDFFKPEVRCDFMVDEKRKKIWAIEIDLLLQLDRVCKKHGLKYYLMWGSLLGAARHNGFVPWDDDVDVAMLRSDYNKLLQLGDEFSSPYFLQTPFTDEGYYYAFARLRNSNTSYISDVFRYQRINHGIPIDIFPLDDFIDNGDGEHRFNLILQSIIDNSTYMRMSNPHLAAGDLERVRSYGGGDPKERYQWIEKESSRDNGKNSTQLWMPSCAIYGFKRDVFLRADFSNDEIVDFEGFKFPVPTGWRNVLKTAYGEWHLLPPIEKRYPWYGADFFDADVCYVDYLNN